MNVKRLAKLAIVAALYVVLTVCLNPISYGGIQFRIAEMLMLLCIYRKDYAIALIAGCFVANIFSPYGIVDMVFGTLATLIACLLMILVKKIYIAWIFPVLSNGIIVGLEIVILDKMVPFWNSFFVISAGVALGEAVVLIVGVIVFKLLEKNEAVMELIKE